MYFLSYKLSVRLSVLALMAPTCSLRTHTHKPQLSNKNISDHGPVGFKPSRAHLRCARLLPYTYPVERGEALRRVRRGGGHPLGAFVTPDVYLSERRFGGGSAAAVADAADGGARGPGRLTHE